MEMRDASAGLGMQVQDVVWGGRVQVRARDAGACGRRGTKGAGAGPGMQVQGSGCRCRIWDAGVGCKKWGAGCGSRLQLQEVRGAGCGMKGAAAGHGT